ncbi:MAG: polysaccharide deacetylase family protein [Elusimicrobiales bacterium]
MSAHQKIPVLVYHKIAEPSAHDSNPNTCVTPADFSNQMRLLSMLGYRTVDPGQYLNSRLGLPADLPDKPVLITFDDAFESVRTRALPVLENYGFRAALFMVFSGFGRGAFWDGEPDDSPNLLLGPGGLRELGGAGWLIGSHGVSHCNFRDLDAPALAKEACRSKSGLEDALGREITWFAYPYGAYTPAAKRALAEAGYKIGFATEEGDGDIFAVPRRIISGKSGLLNFALRLRQAGRSSLL